MPILLPIGRAWKSNMVVVHQENQVVWGDELVTWPETESKPLRFGFEGNRPMKYELCLFILNGPSGWAMSTGERFSGFSGASQLYKPMAPCEGTYQAPHTASPLEALQCVTHSLSLPKPK